MSRTVTLPDSVYEKLEAVARARGLQSVEELLEQLPLPAVEHNPLTEAELQRRREVVAEIDRIRESIHAAHGVMPDSVDLIREDRER
jgi:hypothetical protein